MYLHKRNAPRTTFVEWSDRLKYIFKTYLAGYRHSTPVWVRENRWRTVRIDRRHIVSYHTNEIPRTRDTVGNNSGTTHEPFVGRTRQNIRHAVTQNVITYSCDRMGPACTDDIHAVSRTREIVENTENE